MTRTLAFLGALALWSAKSQSQIVERPVPFDNNGRVMVMTPYIAERASLRAPWWPVAGEFNDARMFTTNDSTFVLAVSRKSGVVERYTISVADRDAIRAIVSRLPSDVIAARTDARNAFVKNQTFLGLLVYGPAFSEAIADNDAGRTAGYLVVAGGSFFAASEIARRSSISRAQSDLSFNMGHNGALLGWGGAYLFKGGDRAQAASAFVGGLAGTAIGLGIGRGMTEADAAGAAFGSDIGALIGWGTAEAIRGPEKCTVAVLTPGSPFTAPTCSRSLSDRTEVGIVIAAGLIGYQFGVLYPRNSAYHVTPGDIHALWSTTLLGMTTFGAFLGENSTSRQTAVALTTGGVVGIIAGDRFLAQRFDHSRTEGGRLFLGTAAGGLMGAGIAALAQQHNPSPHLVLGLGAVGGLAGLIATEYYLDPASDAGTPRVSVSFSTAGLAATASRIPGNHSIIDVRF
ncbi:MAG: hypothetical protein ACJ8AK_07700 [Gemmatimonadaceae bacterium]